MTYPNRRTACMAAALLLAGSARAQGSASFPDKPIRIIVPFAPGAIVDMIPRDIGSELSKRWGQPVVIENKPGAGSMVGAEYVARATPDGYTLLMATSSTLSVAPHLFTKLRFAPLKDLAPVTLVATAPNVLMVSNSSGITSVADLIQRAKAAPGTLSYASAGVGGILHLQAEAFARATGTRLIHVPYQGSQQAMADLVSNRVQMIIDIYGSNAGNLSEGKLKPLAVMSKQRLAQLPGVPTIGEVGYPELAADMWFGLAASAQTPPALMQRLSQEIADILAMPAMRSKYAALGVNATGSSPAQFQQLIDSEGQRWSQVIREANVKVD